MIELIESGRIADLILVLMVVEGVVLSVLALLGRLNASIAGLLLNLAAGGFLLLGLGAAFGGSGWMTVGAWLSGALLAHVGDLVIRLRGKSNN